jgi:hypothetical protein
MKTKKLSVEQQRLHDLILGEYLGLGDIRGMTLPDPFIGMQFTDDITRELVGFMRNPRNFFFTCKHLLNIELAPFQLVVLHELWYRKYPMFIGSRGASKSFLLAVYAILRAVINQGSKIIIVGAAFRQAKVIFEYIESIWHNAPLLRDLIGTAGRSGPRRDIDRCTCILGDSTIIALPLGDGTKIRGQRANYIIADEFAAIPREIYENVVSGFAAVSSSPVQSMKSSARNRILKSLGMWNEEMEQEDSGYGNQAILSGTAYYSFNHFADYWKQYKAIIESKGDRHKLEEIFQGDVPAKFNWKDFCIIRLPVELLPEGFMDEKHVARSKATVHSGIYNMEFGATFATDSNGFFKRSLIESCVTTEPIELPSGAIKFHASIRGNVTKKYIYGVDPASENDNFSIVIIEANPDHRRVVYCWTTTRQNHKQLIRDGLVAEQDFYGYCAKKIRELMTTFPCLYISIDSQGGGVAVAEALHDPDKMKANEHPIWPVIDFNDPKDSDGYPGLHILQMVNFSDAEYTRKANHGMRKDFEDKVLLFPFFDPLSIGFAIEEDKRLERRYDTLEECVMEIEELKNELTTIVHTQTLATNRDRWDTPEIKLPGNKKGRLRKDRYSALLMANMVGRTLQRTPVQPERPVVGSIAGQHNKDNPVGALYVGPAHIISKINPSSYGMVVKRQR